MFKIIRVQCGGEYPELDSRLAATCLNDFYSREFFYNSLYLKDEYKSEDDAEDERSFGPSTVKYFIVRLNDAFFKKFASIENELEAINEVGEVTNASFVTDDVASDMEHWITLLENNQENEQNQSLKRLYRLCASYDQANYPRFDKISVNFPPFDE